MISSEAVTDKMHLLSREKIDIISYIREGLSSREIAETISISVKTVEVHRYNILKKLNVKNVAALVNYINTSQLVLD
jgi:two-component system invasion response regulator UvrY